MNPRAILVIAALCAACAFPASASAEVRVSFAAGRVSIHATNATVGEILNEWARVGGSKFVNIEKLTATSRLTLAIENEVESRAIETLLRSTAGYLIAAQDSSSTHLSAVKSVFIVGATRGTASADNELPIPMPVPAPAAQEPVYSIPSTPRPDDDGPARRETPPPPPAAAQTIANPAGNASPLPKGTTQTLPGLGIVTSSTPGAIVNSPATTRQRPTVTPTRPGGGGGTRR